MQNSSGGGRTPRLAPGPFVSGRPIASTPPAAATRLRPFSPAAPRETALPTERSPSNWSVARYVPGMAADPEWPDGTPGGLVQEASSTDRPNVAPEAPEATVSEGITSASTVATVGPEVSEVPPAVRAIEVLTAVAQRLQRGEIQLATGASMESEPAVIAAVLSALLGAPR